MRIEEFNAMTEQEAATQVRPCVAIDSFVETVVGGRPYADVESLLAGAAAQTDEWTAAEVEGALADHPRIGERHLGKGASAQMSRREQAGLGPTDTAVQERLREGNARYEAAFGRIYLVRAAGRTPDELLAMLEQRLTNDPATELEVTKGQLGEIALLRLEGMFAA